MGNTLTTGADVQALLRKRGAGQPYGLTPGMTLDDIAPATTTPNPAVTPPPPISEAPGGAAGPPPPELASLRRPMPVEELAQAGGGARTLPPAPVEPPNPRLAEMQGQLGGLEHPSVKHRLLELAAIAAPAIIGGLVGSRGGVSRMGGAEASEDVGNTLYAQQQQQRQSLIQRIEAERRLQTEENMRRATLANTAALWAGRDTSHIKGIEEQGQSRVDVQGLKNTGGVEKQEAANVGGMAKQTAANAGGLAKQVEANKGTAAVGAGHDVARVTSAGISANAPGRAEGRGQAVTFGRANEYDKLTKDFIKSNTNMAAVEHSLSDPNAILGPADWGLLMGHLQQFRAGGMRINNVEVQGLQNATSLMDRASRLGQNVTVGAVLGPADRQAILKITKDVIERTRQDRLNALRRAGFRDDEIGPELRGQPGGAAPAGPGAPSPAATPTRPPNVPADYEYDLNGSHGRGWYKPTLARKAGVQ